jgi:xylulokinase
MKRTLLIGIDLGTQGTKTAIYDADGEMIADAFEDSALVAPAPGHVEENAETRYGAVLRTIKTVVEKSGAAPGEVAAIGLDGQMAGVMGVGGDFNAVTPYDSWLDTRCEKYMGLLREGGEDAYIELSGCPVTYAHAPKILWWMHERPEAYRKISKFVMMNAYVAGKLTGLTADDAFIDYTQLHFAGFGDIQKLRWSTDMTSTYGVDAGKLPRIVNPWDTVGRLTAEQAGLCGLSAGVPVVAGCGDQPATSLGAGVLEPGDAFDVAGTASLFACCVDRFTPDTEHKTLICARSIIGGRWLAQAYINGGGLSVRWFKELFDLPGDARGYETLEAEAADAPPGSGGLLFVPHFQGRVCPNDPYVRGGFTGLNWTHGRGHMFRAVMESIGYEYGLYADIMRGAGRSLPMEKVIVIGGGAKSALFNKIKSDILGIPYSPSARGDAPTLGSAINAGFGAGVYQDIAGAARRMIRFKDEIQPDATNTKEYEIYRQLYKQLLADLRDIYKKLPRN